MANTEVHRTPSGSGDSLTTWTLSTWVKIQSNNNDFSNTIFSASNGTNYMECSINSAGILDWMNVSGGSANARLKTRKVFRDTTAWQHLVFVWDTTNGTSGNRMRLYQNGEELDPAEIDTHPSSGLSSIMNTAIRTSMGSSNGGAPFLNGNLAHTYFCDGTAYAPTVFGEVDSTSGTWVAKSSASVTYGTNGFFLEYKAGATGTDSSGKTNNFTTVGNMTSPKDNPMNNYCTMNSLDNFYPSATFTNGATTIATDNATWTTASQWLQSGLWYWEVQPTGSLGGGECMGILDRVSQGTTENVYSGSGLYGAVVRSGGNVYLNSSDSGNISPSGDLWASGDVIGIYMDLNANKIYFAKNGTILNSGTGKALTDPLSTLNFAYTPIWGASNSSATTANFNFGNGYLGTSVLTGTTYADSNGEGKFKYSPNNSGGSSFDSSAKNFLAICTNNIATGS